MYRKLILVLAMAVLCACSKTDPNFGLPLADDKSFVISQLQENAYEVCEYNGRVNVKYTDYSQSTAFRAIVNKQCDGFMQVSILGPFNIVYAEIVVENGLYNVYRGKQNITHELPMALGPYEIELLQEALTLPPPMPDMSYDMFINPDSYIFSKGGTKIAVSNDFMVTLVDEPSYAVGYLWDKNELASVVLTQGLTAITISFTDKPVIP